MKFTRNLPAVGQLKAALESTLVSSRGMRGAIKQYKRKYLRGLDGRQLHVRSIHSALNLLLQSAGAILCKAWIVFLEERLQKQRGYIHSWQGDYANMLWVHDEVQIACRTPEIAAVVVEEAQAAMRDAQAYFKFRCRLDTEGKIGKNWKETH